MRSCSEVFSVCCIRETCLRFKLSLVFALCVKHNPISCIVNTKNENVNEFENEIEYEIEHVCHMAFLLDVRSA